MRKARQWYTYVLLCGDGSLYTGSTTNVLRRLAQHRTGKGAKYTRGRGPLKLVYYQSAGSRAVAQRLEAFIKHLPTNAKWQLITTLPGGRRRS